VDGEEVAEHATRSTGIDEKTAALINLSISTSSAGERSAAAGMPFKFLYSQLTTRNSRDKSNCAKTLAEQVQTNPWGEST